MIGIAARLLKHGYILASMTFLERQPTLQAAALCHRFRDGTVEILLITSRRSGRWGIPKGTIESGELSYAAAEREAREEAGIIGQISTDLAGEYTYRKEGSARLHFVAVHLLHALSALEEFEEKGQRQLQWVAVERAAAMVAEPALKDTILACRGLGTSC